MSSQRFPGKVLAPLHGEPLIRHVISAVEHALPEVPITVLTSNQVADDPLAQYLKAEGRAVFRGTLDNVFERFRACVREHPCDWILRISADSPLLAGHVLRKVAYCLDRDEYDLISTIFPRSFPRGWNAELIRAEVLEQVGTDALSQEDQEHVTPFFYRHPDRFRILAVQSGNPQLAEFSLAVDTVDDLHRIEMLSSSLLQDLKLRTGASDLDG